MFFIQVLSNVAGFPPHFSLCLNPLQFTFYLRSFANTLKNIKLQIVTGWGYGLQETIIKKDSCCWTGNCLFSSRLFSQKHDSPRCIGFMIGNECIFVCA